MSFCSKCIIITTLLFERTRIHPCYELPRITVSSESRLRNQKASTWRGQLLKKDQHIVHIGGVKNPETDTVSTYHSEIIENA